jgi:hypothetical protein
MNRIEPNMAPSAYQTYTIDRDRDVAVKAACTEVGCEAYAHGWEVTCDEQTDLGRAQAHYIRTQAGRDFTERRSLDDALTVFRFSAFQRGFTDHRTMPEVYGVHAGDWRRRLGHVRTHTRPGDWVEDMQEQFDQFAADRARG